MLVGWLLGEVGCLVARVITVRLAQLPLSIVLNSPDPHPISAAFTVKMSGGKAASPDDEDAVGESDEDDDGDSHQDGTDGESNDGMGEVPSAETPSPTKLTPRRSARLSARKSGSRASDSSARRVSSRRSSRRKAAAGNLSESDVDGAASFN